MYPYQIENMLHHGQVVRLHGLMAYRSAYAGFDLRTPAGYVRHFATAHLLALAMVCA